MRESVAYAIENNADVWMCLGDVSDPDNGGATLRSIELTIETAIVLCEAGIPSVWLAGNHCCQEDSSGATVLSPLSALSRAGAYASMIHVAEQPLVVEIGDVSILCLPFAPVSHAYDPERAAEEGFARAANRKRVVVVSHLMMPGIVPGEETDELPRGRDMPFPFAQTREAVMRLQAHYHRRQVYDPCDGGPVVHVIGSAMRLTASDGDSAPGFLEVDL